MNLFVSSVSTVDEIDFDCLWTLPGVKDSVSATTNRS
jgi:hypothetical protein